MKVALIIKNNELTILDEENVNVIIFNFNKDKVVGVENIPLEEQNKESIESWLYQKSINKLYLSEIDQQTHQKLESKGIQVGTLDTLVNDELFKSLALITS